MVKNLQDSYVSSVNETYYATYTSNGRINGDDTPKYESKQSNILPERYKENALCGKVYYQGKLITYYELIQTAVEIGAISLDESETVGWNMRNLQDVADAIAGGTPLSEMDRYKLHDLMLYDRELYDASVNIGRAKSEYDTFTNMYQNGQLTEQQFKHDCYPLLLLLFGKDADINNKSQLLQLSDFFEQDRDEFLKNAFANYSPSNQSLVDKLLIEKKYHSYSGVY